MNMATAHRHYNPDWLSDDDLVANFVARQADFSFLRDELARAPREGSVQHYLLVGARGAGKTTLLKRLAIAIRRDADLTDHLIALSFPEELYQVKNLADFWWAACAALVDELDRLGQKGQADRLMDAVESPARRGANADPLADTGLILLLQASAALERRPVLLVDNLDQVFQRIDKKGRKLKDPHAPAYWALREQLSTTRSPIVIGGSVRLSEPFTDYDKAFYDFFIPKRLGKLDLDEVHRVLEQLADAHGAPEVKERLHARPSRVGALYELTGGNPRALGLIFELLRQGPNGRAVEDFERLMDLTTPYYKARFEDLAEQAQVVMHALAVRRPGDGGGLRFGHTAAEIASHAGLSTGTVSAQMDVLEREGLVEKSATHGRTQYRILEQLFRLWLQMRGTRRIRDNVIGLTEFLEAMFDLDELRPAMNQVSSGSALAGAKFSFAVAGADCAAPWRRGLEAQGADRLLQHLQDRGAEIGDFFRPGDLPEDLAAVARMREQLQHCNGAGFTPEEQDALLGSVELSVEKKQASVRMLCAQPAAPEQTAQLRRRLNDERQRLMHYGLRTPDLTLLFGKRARGYLPLPCLTPQDTEPAFSAGSEPAVRAMLWRLVGARNLVRFVSDDAARDWLEWGLQHATEADATEWANVAGNMRRSRRFVQAQQALAHALSLGGSSRASCERGALLKDTNGDLSEAETAYRKAIELDPADARPWNSLGILLANKLKRFDEAEAAYRKAIELDPAYAGPWNNLGNLLADRLKRFDEAEAAYRKAIELDPAYAGPWNNLGNLLADRLKRFDEAEAAYRKAIELDPAYARAWYDLGYLLGEQQSRFDEAAVACRKAIELDPTHAVAWNGLGFLLGEKMNRVDEAENAYRRALELDPDNPWTWNNLGILLDAQDRLDEAAVAYSRGATLGAEVYPYWRKRRCELTTRRYTSAARRALDAGDLPALREAFGSLLAGADGIATILVSEDFVEGFLARVLADRHGADLLTVLRELGFEKHARPLLLAVEAAIGNRADKLAELEPEIRAAAQQMFERLTVPREKEK